MLRHYVGNVDLVAAGHCGFAFSRQIGPVTWINTGAIGIPALCGDPRTRFAALENQKTQFQHLPYGHYAAPQAMKDSGLQQGYHKSLLDDYWPSEEVLPAELCRELAIG